MNNKLREALEICERLCITHSTMPLTSKATLIRDIKLAVDAALASPAEEEDDAHCDNHRLTRQTLHDIGEMLVRIQTRTDASEQLKRDAKDMIDTLYVFAAREFEPRPDPVRELIRHAAALVAMFDGKRSPNPELVDALNGMEDALDAMQEAPDGS